MLSSVNGYLVVSLSLPLPLFMHVTFQVVNLLLMWLKFSEGKNGYIIVTANGGINQQRVAVSYVFCCDIICSIFL